MTCFLLPDFLFNCGRKTGIVTMGRGNTEEQLVAVSFLMFRNSLCVQKQRQQLSAISVMGFVFSDLTTPCSSVFSYPSVMSLSLSASPCWAVINQFALWKLLLSLLMAQLRQQGPPLFQLIISTVKLFTVLYKRKDRNVSSSRPLGEPMASWCQPFQSKKEQRVKSDVHSLGVVCILLSGVWSQMQLFNYFHAL